MKHATPIKVYIALVLANLFWGGNYVAAVVVVKESSALQLTFIRWAVAIVPLVVLAQVIERPNWRSAIKEWWQLAILAILGIIGYNLLLYMAVQFTPPLDAALIGSITPALIVLISFLFLGVRAGAPQIAGILVSILGVLVVLTKGDLTQLAKSSFNIGDLMMVGASLGWAIYTIVGRRLRTPPITATAVQSILTVIMLTPFVIANGGVSMSFSPNAWVALAYVSIFPSILAFPLWNIGAKIVGSNRSGVYLNLVVVFTAIIGLFFGNAISLVQVLGAVLVCGGVYLTSRSHRETAVESVVAQSKENA